MFTAFAEDDAAGQSFKSAYRNSSGMPDDLQIDGMQQFAAAVSLLSVFPVTDDICCGLVLHTSEVDLCSMNTPEILKLR